MFLGDAQLQKEWITSQQPQEGPPRVLWLGCPWGPPGLFPSLQGKH